MTAPCSLLYQVELKTAISDPGKSNGLILYETSRQDGRFSHVLSAAHNSISWKLCFCFIRLFSSRTYLGQQLSLVCGKDTVLCISVSTTPPAVLVASNVH